MKLKILFIVTTLGLANQACVHRQAGVINKRYTKFGVELPKESWVIRPFRGADIFLEHQTSPAAIFLSAQCSDIKDSPLEALTAQLLVDFEQAKYLKQERIKLSEREALISELSVKIDGVERFLKTMVMRKNRCVYDVILNSPANQPEITADFDKLVTTFWAEADL